MNCLNIKHWYTMRIIIDITYTYEELYSKFDLTSNIFMITTIEATTGPTNLLLHTIPVFQGTYMESAIMGLPKLAYTHPNYNFTTLFADAYNY